MVSFVNDMREMTSREAREVFQGYYIGFLVTEPTERMGDFRNWKGRVLYTAEKYTEQYEIPPKTEDGKKIIRLYGWGLKDLPMGGVIVEKNK